MSVHIRFESSNASIEHEYSLVLLRKLSTFLHDNVLVHRAQDVFVVANLYLRMEELREYYCRLLLVLQLRTVDVLGLSLLDYFYHLVPVHVD